MTKIEIETKKILFPNITIDNKAFFFGFINRYIHRLTYTNKDQFIAENLNVDLIHKSTANAQQPYIMPYVSNNMLHIIAYGKQAIKTLDCWLAILQKKQPIMAANYKEILKKEVFFYTEKKHLYTSRNWIAYNNCKLQNGFFYKENKDKQQELANFQSVIIGNVRTFFAQHNIQSNATENPLKISVLKLEANGTKPSLLKKGEPIKKHHFSVLIESQWELPSLFFLGQNVGYGNGVFTRIM